MGYGCGTGPFVERESNVGGYSTIIILILFPDRVKRLYKE